MAPTPDAPIVRCIENWHACIRGELPGGLDALLTEDVVFYSPIVFSPQRGRDLTKLYLQAAGATLGGEPGTRQDDGPLASGETKFHYTRQVLDGHDALLEFETELEGLYVNGIDLIRCDDRSQIVEFKVMVRPLKAVNAIHRQMMAMLEKMKPA